MELGPYTLERPIGRGAQGRVFRARHRETDQAVAVKVLNPGVDRRALDRELRAMAALDHPNVLLLHDRGVVADGAGDLAPGSPWVAVELGDGDLQARPPTTGDEVRDALGQILAGLAHAHARGVVHRDLKPENVLWVRGRWKLADFGLALVGGERATTRAGSPAFMAPEQIRGVAGEVGARSDLYAVGCLAWTLWCGRPPFDRATVDEVLTAQLAADLPEAPELDPAWWAWLDALLQKDPRDRPAFAADAARSMPAADGRRVGLAAPQTSSPTWDLQSAPVGPEPDPAPLGRAIAVPRAPFEAEGWRGATPLELVPRHGATLATFGLRRLRLVGRDQELARCWAALGEVHASGRAAALVLVGAEGSGRSALARELGERVHERGAARVVWRTADRSDPLPGPSAPARADRPTLLVCDDLDEDPQASSLIRRLLTARRVERAPVLIVAVTAGELPSADRVELGPVSRVDTEAMIRQLVRTSDREVAAMAVRSEGHPSAVLEVVRQHLGLGDGAASDLADEVDPDSLATLALVAASLRPLPLEVWRTACAEAGLPSPDSVDRLGWVTGDPARTTTPIVRRALLARCAPEVLNRLHRVLADSQLHHQRGQAALPHLAELGDRDGLDRAWSMMHSQLAIAEEAELDALGRLLPPNDPRWFWLWSMRSHHIYGRGNQRAAAEAAGNALARATTGADRALAEVQLAKARISEGWCVPGTPTLDGFDTSPTWVQFGRIHHATYGRHPEQVWPMLERSSLSAELLERQRVHLHEFLGDLDGLEALSATMPEIPGNAGSLAWCAFLLGDHASLRRHAAAAMDEARAQTNLQGLANALILAAEVDSVEGRHQNALDALDAAEAVFESLGVAPGEAWRCRARVHLRRGDRSAVAELADRSARWIHPDARSDLRGGALVLHVLASAGAERERAIAAFEADLADGGNRSPELRWMLVLGAEAEPDAAAAGRLRALADGLCRTRGSGPAQGP